MGRIKAISSSAIDVETQPIGVISTQENEEEVGIEIEDPNLLIGEDEDDDYPLEDEEDITPKELPSV